jgi:hypothetical protein
MIIYTNKTYRTNVDGMDIIRISISSKDPEESLTVAVPIEDFSRDVNKYLDVIKSEFSRLLRCSSSGLTIDDSNYEDVRNEIVNMKF